MSVAIVIVHKNIWKLIKNICTVLIKMVYSMLVLCLFLYLRQSLKMVSHFSVKANTCKLTNSKPVDSKKEKKIYIYIYIYI
jgi:hypothetical protein